MGDSKHAPLKQKLIDLIRIKSFKEGDFTLASGRKSRFYVDLKATSLHPEGAWLIGQLGVEAIRDADLDPQAVGGLTLGADPLATALSLAAREAGWFWPAFIVRKGTKSHGTSRMIEGLENVPAGGRVLVLEDSMTTAGSALEAYERVREAGLSPIAFLTIVDREEGGAEAIARTGLPLLKLTTLNEIRGC